MNSTELIKKIKDNDLQKLLFHLDCADDYLEDTEFESEDELYKKFEELELGEMEEMESVCNSDEMYCVINFKDHGIYLKLSGEYDSYGQYEHDYDCGIVEVKPETKTVTVYN